MKKYLLILFAAITTIALVCCKTTEKPNFSKYKTGLIPDDPKDVAKVKTISSAEFVESGYRESLGGEMNRGKPDRVPPTISIIFPVNKSTVSGVVSIVINASDNIGVTSIQTAIDGKSFVGTSWETTKGYTNGQHIIKATAYDAAGNFGSYSDTVNVNNPVIPPADVTPPAIKITSPADGSIFNRGIIVPVTVNATDNTKIDSVILLVDGLILNYSTIAPYSTQFSTANVSSGNHVLTLIAYDPAHNQGFNKINFTVKADTVINPPTLPVSDSIDMPYIGDQGSEGTCAAWAGRNAVSAMFKYKTGAAYSSSTNIMSEEFIYNEIGTGSYCDGTSLLRVLWRLRDQGVCTEATMPNVAGCTTMPNSAQYAEALNYRIKDYAKVYVTDVTAIKTMIHNKKPLICQITIDDNFRNQPAGYIWNSFSTNPGFHAVTVTAYDDNKHAFLLMNQWGPLFGDRGYRWVDYDFFKTVSSDLFVMIL